MAQQPSFAATERIAYVGADDRVHVMSVTGGDDVALPTRGEAWSPRWSQVTGEIVFEQHLSTGPTISQLSVVDPATEAVRVLVPPELRVNYPPQEYWAYNFPQFTTDGSAVVYKKASSTRHNHAYMRVPAQGGPPAEIAGFGFFTRSSAFDISPADGRIAITENGLDAEAGSSRLVVANPDGSNSQVVLPLGSAYYHRPVWTPDGRMIAVAQDREPTAIWTLVLVDPGTKAQHALGNIPRESQYTFSPDGSRMVLSAGDTKQLRVIELANFNEQRPIGYGRMPSWELRRLVNGS